MTSVEARPGPPPPGAASRVILIGMMGAGKSTIGQMLSERLGWPYLDSDAEIERTTGFTVPQIWKARGEAAFRAEEARVLAEGATSDGPAVISVAGGAVLDPDNRRRIRSGGLVVWLRAEIATLAARVGPGTGRPLLEGDPVGNLTRLYTERRPLYEDLADLIVDVDQLDPVAVTDRIVTALNQRGVVADA